MLEDLLGVEWNNELIESFSKPFMTDLSNFVVTERKTKKIYPETSLKVLRIFKSLQLSDIKVVILGQDPYADGSADGYAFSCAKGKEVPIPLKNIFREVETDLYDGLKLDQDPNLQRWVDQGVFLYNTALTVEAGKPGSHSQQWVDFTIIVLDILSRKDDIVWILLGSHAKAYHDNGFIRSKNIIRSLYPSSSMADKGFFGSKPFSKCNEMLKQLKKEEVKW